MLLQPADLEPLLALSEATMARRSREQAALDLVASERLDRLVEVISLAYGVFEQPSSTEAWLKAPHPLLHQVSPLPHGYRREPGVAAAAGPGAGRTGVSDGVLRAWRLSKAR